MTDSEESRRQAMWRLMDACLSPDTPRGCDCIDDGECGVDQDAFEATGKLICSDCWERMQEDIHDD
jgi:hypothetical protein